MPTAKKRVATGGKVLSVYFIGLGLWKIGKGVPKKELREPTAKKRVSTDGKFVSVYFIRF